MIARWKNFLAGLQKIESGTTPIAKTPTRSTRWWWAHQDSNLGPAD